jgi:hypothetical protein
MRMNPGVRKFALTAHLTLSVGWIGAVVAYLALGIAAARSQDVEIVRAAWTGMELIGWYVIVPFALTSLLTGVLMALGTKWGLFRHYWVLFSFVLTLVATIVLVLHMRDVTSLADLAQRVEGATLEALGGDLLHAGLGLVVLLVVQALNMYKPAGITRYGWRQKQ